MPSLVRLGFVAAVVALATMFAAALRIERRLGGAGEPWLAYDVDIPYEVYEAARGTDAVEGAWRARLRGYRVKTSLGGAWRSNSVGVRVEVIGARPEEAAAVLKALAASSRLEFRAVASGEPVMQQWYAAVERDGVDVGDVEAEPEIWHHYETDVDYQDAYLKGPSIASLDRAVEILGRDAPLPSDLSVMYEFVVPDQQATSPRPYYRTYLVRDEVILANEHIDSAFVTYDPNTLQAEVLLTFTREGGERFGDATSAMVGQKLAIILDGRIRSAPIVQQTIRGGRASITMGGGSPADQERDARDLVATLGGGARLPDGLEARQVGHSAGSPVIVWLMRLLAGLAAGAVAWVLAWLADRRRWFAAAPPVRPEPEVPNWFEAMVPIALTFGIPLALWFAAREVVMPGINPVELDNVFAAGSGGGGDPSLFGVFALGIMPVVSAFILVELVAAGLELLVPARRGRRLGTPADRRTLDRVGWGVTLALALLQGYFVAEYLASTPLPSVGSLWRSGPGVTALLMVTLAAGVMVQVIAAEIITRFGLCNGYLALLTAGAVADVVQLTDPPPIWHLAAADQTFLLATFALAAFAAFAATRVRTLSAAGEPGPRLPYTGVVPASIVRGGLGLFAFAALWSTWVAEHLHWVQERVLLFELGALVPMTALILWTARRPWTAAGVVATLGFLGVLVLVPFAIDPPLRVILPIAEGVLVGVVLAELYAGLQARTGLTRPTTVLVIHDVFRADEAADRLTAAGIPHAVLGIRARAALRLLGPFVPIEIRVPEQHADSARAALEPASPA